MTERIDMQEQLIKLRAALQEAVDRLDVEEIKKESLRSKRNLIIRYLEAAKIEAGAMLRDLQEK